MRKVVVYCDHWQNGGVESYLMNQLRHWDLSKMECSVLTAEKTTNIYDHELQQMKVQQYVLLEGESPSPVLRILKTFRAFKRFLKNHPCDVLYLNLTNGVTMRYARIAKRMGIPRRVVHSHNSGLEPSRIKAVKMLAHIISKILYMNAPTDWWACSDMAASFLFSQSVREKVAYIPNAIKTDSFVFRAGSRKDLRNRWNIENDAIKIIGTVGRCVAQKNQSFLLDIFAEVYKLLPEVKVLLIGDGPLRSLLEVKAEELGITDACIFYGFTDNVAPLYSAIDVFCLPSLVEGFPVSAVEAQAAGCRCLLSEAITDQVRILEETRRLALDKKLWQENLLNALQRPFNRAERMKAAEAVKNNGFDIVDNAQKVQKMLMN